MEPMIITPTTTVGVATDADTHARSIAPADQDVSPGCAYVHLAASESLTLMLRGTPESWRRLAKVIEDAAMEAERQIATDSDRLTSPMGDRRDRAVTCCCGKQTWNLSVRCDACMDRDEAAAADLPGLATR